MKIEQLTFFRFLAASIVVIFHYGREFAGSSVFWSAGPEMVTFFFVLSGFVMIMSYSDKDMNISSYWWARISRIMPVYLFALTLIVIAFYFSNMEISIISLILNIFLLQSWFPPHHPTSLNTPGWSMSVEAFFYFLFPFILSLSRRISPLKFLTCAIVFWMLTQSAITLFYYFGFYKGIYSTSHEYIHYFPLSHLCSFLIGIAGGKVFVGLKKINNYSSFVFPAAMASFVFLVISNQWRISNFIGLTFAYGASFHAPMFLLFIISFSLCQSKLMNLLKWNFLVLLGNSSYSMYMLQKPVHAAFLKYFSSKIKLHPYHDFIIYFIVLTVVSAAIYLLFEKPAHSFLRYSLPKFIASKK
jgi:peptidoglycan/LPS O-acetylase OafA/YrhL